MELSISLEGQDKAGQLVARASVGFQQAYLQSTKGGGRGAVGSASASKRLFVVRLDKGSARERTRMEESGVARAIRWLCLAEDGPIGLFP